MKNFQKTVEIVLFYVMFILVINVTPDREFVFTSELTSISEGFNSFLCDFTQNSQHSLDPKVDEKRNIICSISSYFIFDKIDLIIPNVKTDEFQIRPKNCFEKVLQLPKNDDDEVELEKLTGLKWDNSTTELSNKTKKSLIVPPFNIKEIYFLCILDYSKKTNGSSKGRIGYIEVNVLKYPYKIYSLNLTNETHEYLPNAVTKSNFNDEKSISFELEPGELVVLVCKNIDKDCFTRSKDNKRLFISNKITFYKNFIVFKSPIYIEDFDSNAVCLCKVDGEVHEIIVKPKIFDQDIEGCDFTNNERPVFSKSVIIRKEADKQICVVKLSGNINKKLIGIRCPEKMNHECFFKVFKYKKGYELVEIGNKTYLDNFLKISSIEFFNIDIDLDEGDFTDTRIFALAGRLKHAATFYCTCRTGSNIGFMLVELDGEGDDGSDINRLSFMLVIAIITVYIYL